MTYALHITSGDSAGECLERSGLSGEVLVWRDVLYDGLRKPGWPDSDMLQVRAHFLSGLTAGGMTAIRSQQILELQYQKLKKVSTDTDLVLWFDACLFDQSMLAHLLSCIASQKRNQVEFICIAEYPGIEKYNGLGQLNCEQLVTHYDQRRRADDKHFNFAIQVEKAFAGQNLQSLQDISEMTEVPLQWVPAAAKRWLEEQPDSTTGLRKLEYLVLEALGNGLEQPIEIFNYVAAVDTPPQYWGDITLWATINALADRHPPLVRIAGPKKRLPQWNQIEKIKQFRIKSM